MERVGLEPGAEIGGYTILAPLGSGGMGTVYRAVDGGGTTVALKLLHPHIGADPAARERLRREVAALQRLRHPGVAAVLDAEDDSTEAFLVTELVPGKDLSAHVRSRGPLDAAALHRLADRLADALRAVHEAGVVHRDLKPSNVVLGPQGPVLIDFGVAQSVDETRLTSAGFVVGTPGYLAPELIGGAEPTPETDWWGWAGLLVFAATGRAPFGVRPLEAVLARTREGDADLRGLGPITSGALWDALAPEPGDRATPQEVVAALAEAERRGESFDPDVTTPATGATTVLPGAIAPARTREVATGAATEALPPAYPATERLGTVAAPSDPATRAYPAGGPPTQAYPAGAPPTQAYPAGAPPTQAYPTGGPATQAYPTGAPTQAYATQGPPTEAYPATYPAAGPSTEVYPPARPGDRPGPWAPPSQEPAPAWPGYAEPPVRPAPPRRAGSLLALGLLTVAGAAVRPGVTLLVLLPLLLVARTVGSVVDATLRRRDRVGPRRSDGLRAVVASPWHLLRALVGVLPSLLVAVALVLIVGGVGWWLLHAGGEQPDPLLEAGLLAVTAVIGSIALWWGPGSRTTREGASWALGAVAPGRWGAAVLVLLALAVAGLAVWTLLGGDPVDFSPFGSPPVPSS
ncbi:serine/threonine-protein kinase [Cellulomonas denverensis]|uniref:Protein kinase n=1 Tax=Cellulomonas denverensis TaxID=264297 RepID=A0A7X6QZ89_9CELL|nr:serine/threonine-protein kinase [Cellulomonas denverensis]NKY22915.1 protein kinase [Cellulomonas denverensis]